MAVDTNIRKGLLKQALTTRPPSISVIAESLFTERRQISSRLPSRIAVHIQLLARPKAGLKSLFQKSPLKKRAAHGATIYDINPPINT